MGKGVNKNSHLWKVLTKMCDIAGVDVEKMDFKKERWYMKHTITEKQENEFRKWFVDYLMNSQEARQEFLEFPRKKKSWIKRAVDEFIFNYGWRCDYNL